MDQRGYPVDPSESAVTSGPPDPHLTAWAAVAARIEAIARVPVQAPAQDGHAAA